MSRNLALSLTMIFLNAFSRRSMGIFNQFISKLLGISIAQTGYIQTISDFVYVGVLVVLITTSQIAETTSQRSHKQLGLDIWICRISLCLLIIGNAMLGLSKSLATVITGKSSNMLLFCIFYQINRLLTGAGTIIHVSGDGIYQVLQSVLASFVEPSHYGQLYACSALLELLAGLTGSFVFAGIYSSALRSHERRLLGTPFLFSAVSDENHCTRKANTVPLRQVLYGISLALAFGIKHAT
jgi:hypothetical protein